MELMQQVLGIFAVFSLLGLLVWALKRKQGSGMLLSRFQFGTTRSAQRLLSVTERLPLTAQHHIHLVEVQGKTMLVITHPGGASVHGLNASSDFRQTFHQVLNEGAQQ